DRCLKRCLAVECTGGWGECARTASRCAGAQRRYRTSESIERSQSELRLKDAARLDLPCCRLNRESEIRFAGIDSFDKHRRSAVKRPRRTGSLVIGNNLVWANH